MPEPVQALSVLIAESVSRDDFYDRRTDGYAANEILRIQQVRSDYRLVLDRRLLVRAVNSAAAQNFTVFHLSCHGDDDGILLADEDFVDWLNLGVLLRGYARMDRALVLSCCSGGYVGVTKAFEKSGVFFGYVFGSTSVSGVGFTDCCLAWSILYSQILEYGLSAANLRKTLDKINYAVPGDFSYRRWDGQTYLHYPAFAAR